MSQGTVTSNVSVFVSLEAVAPPEDPFTFRMESPLGPFIVEDVYYHLRPGHVVTTVVATGRIIRKEDGSLSPKSKRRAYVLVDELPEAIGSQCPIYYPGEEPTT